MCILEEHNMFNFRIFAPVLPSFLFRFFSCRLGTGCRAYYFITDLFVSSFSYMCISVLPAYISTTCLPATCRSQKRVLGSLKLVSHVVFKMLYRYSESNPDPLEKQPVLLSTVPSLQLPSFNSF